VVEFKKVSFDQLKENFHNLNDLIKIDWFEFSNLECKSCQQNSTLLTRSQRTHEMSQCACELILFDSSKYTMRLKRSNLDASSCKATTHQHATANAVCSQNNLFFTQLDSDFYFSPYVKNADDQTTSVSQLIKLDSILDSLENIGYYGYATFRGVIQRCGFVDCANMSIYTTQRTTQTQSQSQHLRQKRKASCRIIQNKI
jgi:hypothetical protein